MNEKLYKEICHAREEYMADALTLKEEMEHQDEDADDDDDDDEDNAKDPENAIQRSSQQLDEDKVLKRSSKQGEEQHWTVRRSYFSFTEDSKTKPTLNYILTNQTGATISLPVDEVDSLLESQGTPVDPVHCLEAVSECPGYSQGPNHGKYDNLVPVAANPSISDAAAQAFISSSVYQDTINSSSTFMLVNPEDLQSSEWSRLLTLLVVKCASSEMMNALASKLEADAAEKMAKLRNESARLDLHALLPLTNEDEIEDIHAEAAAAVKDEEDRHDKKADGDTTAVVVDATAIEILNDVTRFRGCQVCPARNCRFQCSRKRRVWF
ncbi:hypothetical protein MHU86_19324 [Fragilaria crotonensis]|nr:hypothetical protein MHU86_19324 [Fragilaria crotonensis]